MSDYVESSKLLQEKAVKSSLGPTNEVNTTEEDREADSSSYNPNQVRAEDLLSYCNEVGIDDNCLRFTHPDYYLENVEIEATARGNDSIKAMMQNVDRKAQNSMLATNNYDAVSEEKLSRSSLASMDIAEQNK